MSAVITHKIWENMEDFSAKMDDLRSTSAALQTAAASGDRKAIGKAVGDVGQSCKACHDEYKSEDYLY